TVLELARAVAADGLDPRVRFVTFGAEESGLHGSQALAARLQNEGAVPHLMVNLDVTGIGTAVQVIGSPEPVQRAPDLARRLGIPAEREKLPP
ncbi:MAG: aminopeptidase, partial [Chloroflexota bacterium]